MMYSIMLVLALVLGGLGAGGVHRTTLERVNLPIEVLEAHAAVVFVGTCTRIESTKTRGSGFENTTYFHHMKVERLCRDSGGAIKVGDTVAVISQTHHWVGEGQPPPSGSGHRGMPRQGERMRAYCTFDAAKQGKGSKGLVWLDAMAPNGWQAPARTVAFIAADDEYKSEETFPKLPGWIESEAKGVITPIQAFAADPATGKPDGAQRRHIANLEKLEHAEAAVMFMRWRELDQTNWRLLEEFLMTGRPIVGLRTSTHMLRMNDPALDVDLPVRLFGQKWIRHAGHQSRTRVLKPETDHPVVRGMKGDFVVRSWLYEVAPLPPDCTVLLWGEVEGGDGSFARQPLVWVREAAKDTVRPLGNRGRPARRMAFTTLGHPEDFEHEEVRRLVARMVLWACDEEETIGKE